MFKSILIKLILAIMVNISVIERHVFAAVSKAPTETHEIVVLIHGLMRTNLSMVPLKLFLEKHGYQADIYTYISPRYTIREHSVKLNQYIKKLILQHPHDKISFVTHSLGGIIARESISHLNKTQLKHIGSMIMLAPPNQGSKLAKLSLKVIPFINSTIKPMSELSSDDDAYVHHVPVPPIKIGIIAGRYDAKVPPSYTHLEGYEKPIVINTTHGLIMYRTQTKELVLRFLKNGSFS